MSLIVPQVFILKTLSFLIDEYSPPATILVNSFALLFMLEHDES
jgi:hypothetical protein